MFLVKAIRKLLNFYNAELHAELMIFCCFSRFSSIYLMFDLLYERVQDKVIPSDLQKGLLMLCQIHFFRTNYIVHRNVYLQLFKKICCIFVFGFKL